MSIIQIIVWCHNDEEREGGHECDLENKKKTEDEEDTHVE